MFSIARRAVASRALSVSSVRPISFSASRLAGGHHDHAPASYIDSVTQFTDKKGVILRLISSVQPHEMIAFTEEQLGLLSEKERKEWDDHVQALSKSTGFSVEELYKTDPEGDRLADLPHGVNPRTGAPILVGPGAARGEVPSSLDQSTGLERMQLLGLLQDIDIFDSKPLMIDHLGTIEDPVWVPSLYPSRMIGCTGFPQDSHDIQWFEARVGVDPETGRPNPFGDGVRRCYECGCVYQLDYKLGGITGQYDAADPANHEHH